MRAPHAEEALALAAPFEPAGPPPAPFPPRALGLGAPGDSRPAPRTVIPPPGGQAVPLPSSPVDREGMYRSLLWVAWAVEECSRAYSRLSSRVGKLESLVDLLESEPSRSGPVPALAAAAPPAQMAAPAPAPPPPPPALDLKAVERIDAIEGRIRQLEYVPLRLAHLQRLVDQLEKAPPPAPAPPPPPPPEAAPLAPDEQESGELEAVYQELDRVAEFVAARSDALDKAVHELRRAAASNGHDAERRMRELEARLERFERLYAAMQAGLQLANS